MGQNRLSKHISNSVWDFKLMHYPHVGEVEFVSVRIYESR